MESAKLIIGVIMLPLFMAAGGGLGLLILAKRFIAPGGG